MAFVLVQHLDPARESALSDILSRVTSLPVREVASDQPAEPNHIYVIPPNADLSITNTVLKLKPRQRTGPHRSIDFFFETLAQDQRERAVGVILSGTATDGTVGLEAIKAEGGITFAQDDSAKYDSMPRSAVAAGCVDFVLSPEDIAKELARIAKHPFVAGQLAAHFSSPEDDRASATAHEDDDTPLPSGGHGTPRTAAKQARKEGEARREDAAAKGFRKILLLLRSHCGVDFSLYKSATIQRRIARRMVLNKQDSLEDYAQFLRGNTKELDALYSDVLISVTSFFRNPEAFEVLKRKVFPRLLQQRGDEPFRVWVLGCSTGQEAYSIAMAFVEAAEKAPRMRKLQVFATDLNDALLDKARHGLYAKNLAQDISQERLRQFFVEEEGGYRVVKSLREMVVFARQNLITDPPFSRMDLVSCRNLLIYLEPSLQQKLLPTFHYALKPEGFLLLGASESIGSFTDLFEPLDRKTKVYSKKAAPTPAFHLPMRKERGEHLAVSQRQVATTRPAATDQGEPAGFRGELNSQREADRVTINKYSPPSVLVNAELQILQFRGPTGAYLEPPTGKASFDVLKMARQGLVLPLRAAINKAKRENKSARRENVQVSQNGETRVVNVEVVPLKNLRERCFLILFENAEKATRAAGVPTREQRPDLAKRRRETNRTEARRATELERELAEMHDYLQSVLEQHDAANEELQASNEEVQSANEELQSINEELETSKEELESANEELTTVNEEMANRNTELNRLNGDLVNLQASTKLAILLLARDLTIRRFSVQAEKQFNLLASDIGRPVSRVRHNLDLTDLEGMVEDVVANVRESEHEVRDKDGHWYSMRVRPYLTLDNKVDGAVLLLVSIDELKRTEREIQAARNYAEAVIRTARDPFVVLRADLSVNTANEGFYKTFKTTPEQAEGRLIFDLAGGAWRIPKLRGLLEDILPRNSFFNDFEVTQDFPHIGRRTMLLNARRLDQGDGVPPMVLLAIEDVTERLRADAATASLAAIINTSHDAIIGKDLNGRITSWNEGAERLFGYSAREAIGQPITMLFPPDLLHEESEIMERIKRGERIGQFDTVRLRKEGSPVDASVTISPITDARGLVIGASKIARDITKRKTAEALVNSQRQALQLLAEDVPLNDVLGFLISIVERYSRKEGMLAAITPLNEAGTHFQRSIGASLPDAFNAAVGGVAVDSPTDLCAEAVRRREAVAVRDFNADAAWRPFGEFVAPYGLRSGWSVPIISSSGKVLGTFANYYRHAGDPTPHNRELVDMVTRTAAIAIERKQAEEALRESEERLRLAQQAARVGTFEWNIQTGVNTWTPEMEELYGLPPGGFRGTQEAWEQLVHPDDHAKVITKQAIEAGFFEGEWRVIWPDGSLHWISAERRSSTTNRASR
jgi:two-component system, chemotaxis family, CheB/CheR fusion protein